MKCCSVIPARPKHLTLRHTYGLQVNHKRIYRLLKEHGLLVNRIEHKAKRVSSRPKPKPTAPNELTEMKNMKPCAKRNWIITWITLQKKHLYT
ncbi:MAG: IS3 family transposase [Deferribacteraceae bacterium]|nr:IS3 family transposase [Deferribacteraceae bacterium]